MTGWELKALKALEVAVARPCKRRNGPVSQGLCFSLFSLFFLFFLFSFHYFFCSAREDTNMHSRYLFYFGYKFGIYFLAVSIQFTHEFSDNKLFSAGSLTTFNQKSGENT